MDTLSPPFSSVPTTFMTSSAGRMTVCSHHSVPSLSKTAIRSAGGTNAGLPGFVTRVTKLTIARLAAPSF